MTISEDISANAKATFVEKWTVRDGTTVLEPAALKLSNDAVHFKWAKILYADLNGSTDLGEKKKWTLSGEVYKSFLHATSRLIRHHGGSLFHMMVIGLWGSSYATIS